MKKTTNECVGCVDLGLYCLGNSCPNRNVNLFYCDECNEETILYETEYGELCAECLLKKFPVVEGSEW